MRQTKVWLVAVPAAVSRCLFLDTGHRALSIVSTSATKNIMQAPVVHQRFELLFPRTLRHKEQGAAQGEAARLASKSLDAHEALRRPVVRKRFELVAQALSDAKLEGRVGPQVAPNDTRQPPPFLVYPETSQQMLKRSSSHDQFLHPPVHMIRRRPPCIPAANGAPICTQADVPPQLTSHQAHFAARGVPRRRPACITDSHKGLFSEIADLGLPLPLPRSTSHTQFVQSIVPRMREPCYPPVNTLFAAADDPGLRRTTSSEQFKQRVVPRQRDACMPTSDHAPFPSGVPFGDHRSTSHATFHELPNATRKPYIPASSGAPWATS